MEPTSGFSTSCRKCGQYIRIEKARKPSALSLLTRLVGGSPKAPAPRSTHARPPSIPLQVLGFSEEAHHLIAQSRPQAARSSLEQKHVRPVVCFDCQHPHKVSEHSTSSLCPNCGSYIDLRDVVIKDRTTQKIRTRGDVTIEKRGALLGTSITCGNLIIEGQVAGSIQASGTVTFKASGKILGEVRCQHLAIEKKCEVHFLQPIHCETAEIFGHVQGRIQLTDRIFINRRASWRGVVSAKTVLLESGAMLEATMEVLPKPLAPVPTLPAPRVPAPPPPPGALSPAESLALWSTDAALPQ